MTARRNGPRVRLHPGLDGQADRLARDPAADHRGLRQRASAAPSIATSSIPASRARSRCSTATAGKELSPMLSKGDEVIVARLDRLSRSLHRLRQILEFWLKHKIMTAPLRHAGRRLRSRQPHEPEMLIGILIVFANYERRLISVRTRKGSRPASTRREVLPLGGVRLALGEASRPRVEQGRQRQGRRRGERAIMAQVRRAAGRRLCLDKIRQHLNYEMKARTRLGGHWTTSRIGFLFSKGSGSWPRP